MEFLRRTDKSTNVETSPGISRVFYCTRKGIFTGVFMFNDTCIYINTFGRHSDANTLVRIMDVPDYPISLAVEHQILLGIGTKNITSKIQFIKSEI